MTELRLLKFREAIIRAVEQGYEHQVCRYLRLARPNRQFAGNPRRLSRDILNLAIVRASRYGYLDIFEDLLDFEPRLINDLKKNIALSQAVANGHRQVVDRILELTGEPFQVEVCLENAAYGGHLDLVEKFIVFGAHDYGQALVKAVQNGHRDVTSRLLELNPVELRYNWGLIGAAMGGHLDLVKSFLAQGATKVGHAFAVAVNFKQLEVMSYLRSLSPPIETQYFYHAMALAAMSGSLDLVQELQAIVQDDVTSTDIEKDTYYQNCLVQAAMKGHLEIVKYFVELGATTEQINDAILMAAKHGHTEVVDYLWSHSDETLDLLLWAAVEENNPKLVEVLINDGVSPLDVETCFRHAAQLGHSDVIERFIFLIAAQPDLVTPAFLIEKYIIREEAKQAGHWDVAEMIK
jgi:ankyrin repeat protein